jgi:hypothetical protein
MAASLEETSLHAAVVPEREEHDREQHRALDHAKQAQE